MPVPTRRTAAILAVAVAAALGGGGAIAATKLLSPQDRSQAIVDDAAKRLGVTPEKLSSALEQAYEAQIDQAVAAGQLSKTQGDALKAQLKAGQLPLTGNLFGLGHGHDRGGFGGFGGAHGALRVGLDAAATYLGLSEDALRTQLESGKSLADVAKAQGKSVAGLKAAMKTALTKQLDQAVTDKKLTADQRTKILADVDARLDDIINNTRPKGGPPGPGGHWR